MERATGSRSGTVTMPARPSCGTSSARSRRLLLLHENKVQQLLLSLSDEKSVSAQVELIWGVNLLLTLRKFEYSTTQIYTLSASAKMYIRVRAHLLDSPKLIRVHAYSSRFTIRSVVSVAQKTQSSSDRCLRGRRLERGLRKDPHVSLPTHFRPLYKL